MALVASSLHRFLIGEIDCVGGLRNSTIRCGCICVASNSSGALSPFTPVDPLGMADWLSDSMVPAPPPPKRLRLTLARSPLRVSNNSSSRFSNPVNSPERAKAAKGVVPANTEASTQWAVKNFTDSALNRSFLDSQQLHHNISMK